MLGYMVHAPVLVFSFFLHEPTRSVLLHFVSPAPTEDSASYLASFGFDVYPLRSSFYAFPTSVLYSRSEVPSDSDRGVERPWMLPRGIPISSFLLACSTLPVLPQPQTHRLVDCSSLVVCYTFSHSRQLFHVSCACVVHILLYEHSSPFIPPLLLVLSCPHTNVLTFLT
jgi:hypothetical protein